MNKPATFTITLKDTNKEKTELIKTRLECICHDYSLELKEE